MGRLIDVDDVMRMLTCVDLNNGIIADAKSELRNVKTAYDVERVVAELEEKQHQANKDMQISELYEDVQAYGGKYLAFGEAIEIVKAGGIDG